MARTDVAVQQLGAGLADVEGAETALHASDGAMFLNDGATYVYLRNTGGGTHVVTFVTPKTVTGGRSALTVADKTISLAAGDWALVPPLQKDVFNQPSGADAGKVYVDSDNTESEVVIVPFR